ncbi:hypothetical protein [Kitasatospora sp. GP82]|uniref:hypothetical protein n=1 Tax=Kitasatospora sp. GP82 TaxID=3035089 RepID=UPI00247344AA|nr:hypothetical protein [Kitasatospora sp. GP82]MDH6129371.1 hypothetical protein [Kitasatospora sp. GP82]
MSIMPYPDMPDHTSPAQSRSADLTVLPSPQAQELLAAAIAGEDEDSESAEDPQLDLLKLLVHLELLGAAGQLHLGTGSRDDAAFIADSMDTQDVSERDGQMTVVAFTSGGRLTLMLELESSGQVAA